MSKLSKLLIIGSGVAVANYYTNNQEKLKEHFDFLKRKAKDSYGYTRCMIRYTKKNGVTEAADYLYKDAVKVANRTKDKVVNTYNNTVEYGKELSSNAKEIKEHASNVRERSAELKINLGTAKEVAEEVKPSVSNFVENAKKSIDSIKEQVSNIKTEVENSNIQEKVETFSNNTNKTLGEVKEKVETEVLNKKSVEDEK